MMRPPSPAFTDRAFWLLALGLAVIHATFGLPA